MTPGCTGSGNNSGRNSYTPKSKSTSKSGYSPSKGNPFLKQGGGNFGTPKVNMSFSGKKR